MCVRVCVRGRAGARGRVPAPRPCAPGGRGGREGGWEGGKEAAGPGGAGGDAGGGRPLPSRRERRARAATLPAARHGTAQRGAQRGGGESGADGRRSLARNLVPAARRSSASFVAAAADSGRFRCCALRAGGREIAGSQM